MIALRRVRPQRQHAADEFYALGKQMRETIRRHMADPVNPDAEIPRVRGEPSEIDRVVGASVRRQRVKLGMSSHDLAVLAGSSDLEMARHERGAVRISAPTIVLLAKALGCPVSALLKLD